MTQPSEAPRCEVEVAGPNASSYYVGGVTFCGTPLPCDVHTPRCQVPVTVTRDASITELMVRVYRTEPCGTPLPCDVHTPRCQVDTEACHCGDGEAGHGTMSTPHAYDGLCGLPLEPTGGPCVTCEQDEPFYIHIPGPCQCVTADWHEHHPYVSPLGRCPVHGAATDRSEA